MRWGIIIIGKHACTRLQFIQACIFSTDPKVAFFITYDLPYSIATDGMTISLGKEFFKTCICLRLVIDASEIGACPDSAFLIPAECIDPVIPNGIWIVIMLFQVNGFAGKFCINKYTSFRCDPVFVVRLPDKISYKDLRFFICMIQDIFIRTTSWIKKFGALLGGSNKYAPIACIIDLFDPVVDGRTTMIKHIPSNCIRAGRRQSMNSAIGGRKPQFTVCHRTYGRYFPMSRLLKCF